MMMMVIMTTIMMKLNARREFNVEFTGKDRVVFKNLMVLYKDESVVNLGGLISSGGDSRFGVCRANLLKRGLVAIVGLIRVYVAFTRRRITPLLAQECKNKNRKKRGPLLRRYWSKDPSPGA